MNIIENKSVRVEFIDMCYNQFAEIRNAIGALLLKGEISQEGVCIASASQTKKIYDCSGPSWSHSSWDVSRLGGLKVIFKEEMKFICMIICKSVSS